LRHYHRCHHPILHIWILLCGVAKSGAYSCYTYLDFGEKNISRKHARNALLACLRGWLLAVAAACAGRRKARKYFAALCELPQVPASELAGQADPPRLHPYSQHALAELHMKNLCGRSGWSYSSNCKLHSQFFRIICINMDFLCIIVCFVGYGTVLKVKLQIF
jgi:hypothetical protein